MGICLMRGFIAFSRFSERSWWKQDQNLWEQSSGPFYLFEILQAQATARAGKIPSKGSSQRS